MADCIHPACVAARAQRPIFVYGTLRPGHHNAQLWAGHADARHDGDAFVIGWALVSNGGFPYMVRAATGQTAGALIVPHPADYDRVLGWMDGLEGYRPGAAHNHYERITVPVVTPAGIVTAWTYTPHDTTRIAELPDVPTNAAGFYDWNCHPRHDNYRRSTR